MSLLCLLKRKGNLLLRKSAFFHEMSPFSIGLELSCDNGERVRVAFALDC
jgi:hypothetical protein